MPNTRFQHPFSSTVKTFRTPSGKSGRFYSLPALAQQFPNVSRLPVSLRIVLESVLRHCDGEKVLPEQVAQLANWQPDAPRTDEIPFMVARVVLQDFTGVPLLADLAAMRSTAQRLGHDPKRIEPLVPVDLVVDHSVMVDHYGTKNALDLNMKLEFQRNKERYQFLKWGMQAFETFGVVPPGFGIVHQVNLEHLARGVHLKGGLYYPDTLVGTDSHTTMINGIGVVGWGVGGIEAEAAMLGQPVAFLTPDVVGFELTGRLREGCTATDLVLTVTEILRQAKVVGKFVEFFGAGTRTLSLPDRATIGNMAPEYGATMGFFPVDERTIDYFKGTGRSRAEIELFEAYFKAQQLFGIPDEGEIDYSQVIELDLSTVSPSLAGPKRPQDRVLLKDMKANWQKDLAGTFAKPQPSPPVTVEDQGTTSSITDGAVVIAAITSCTNTSNPSVMVAAGLLARKAVARGLTRKPWVKTSLAPGSRVVTDYFDKADLTKDLDALGFNTVGYGCTTCIGNSGPLPDPVSQAVTTGNLVVSAVLSGNRNFEGRVNPQVKANYLASPPLVVAYAIAGTTDIDLLTEPIGKDQAGKDVYLKELWPSQKEIAETIAKCITPEMFTQQYSHAAQGPAQWQAITGAGGVQYQWNTSSTYVQEPPFFIDMPIEPAPIGSIRGAYVLASLGDSVTTDHISPAGSIKNSSPAGMYLQELGVKPVDFNSYGARRGNDRVMTRGTFANIRLKNLLAPGTEGGVTVHVPSGQQMSIYDASVRYKQENTPLVILAGSEYGTGSSRDWAAKGTFLLGVKAVIAVSFERIHRSNLVGMGVLPLEFKPGQSREVLKLDGTETYEIALDENLKPLQDLNVTATRVDGTKVEFVTRCRIDTPIEVNYYRHGGILHYVLRQLAKGG